MGLFFGMFYGLLGKNHKSDFRRVKLFSSCMIWGIVHVCSINGAGRIMGLHKIGIFGCAKIKSKLMRTNFRHWKCSCLYPVIAKSILNCMTQMSLCKFNNI